MNVLNEFEFQKDQPDAQLFSEIFSELTYNSNAEFGQVQCTGLQTAGSFGEK